MVFGMQKTMLNELCLFNLRKIDTQNKICQIEAATEQRSEYIYILYFWREKNEN